MDVGSYAWGLSGGGAVSESDRSALEAQISRFASRYASPFTPMGRLEFGLDAVHVPDSAPARDAFELCREVSEPWLVGHCTRTYLFAAGFGVHCGIVFDAEILYVASMLHDLGITARYAASAVDACFAVTGAREAFALASRHGFEDASAVADAISRHLNVDVDLSEGAEAHLLSFGVTLDVGGVGVDRLPSPFVADVLAAEPRDKTASAVAEVVRAQAAAHPDTRSAFLRDVVRLDELSLNNTLDRL